MTVSSSSAIRELVGLRLVFGVHGTDAGPEMIEHFRTTGARGLILYRRNFESPEQLRRLISSLEEAVGRRLLVCVDHEGGRVVMFREGFTIFPDSLCFGTLGREDYVRRQGEIEAAELRSVGVDVNLAPVLDVLVERYGPSLNRSYSKDPDRVARLGRARIQALQSGGISATAKHFPGKGHATQDAHFRLPYIDSTLDEMRDWHLRPFVAAVRAGVDLVMTSHPCYRRIDPEIPATFSRRIVHDLLRGELGFKGVIATDDLEMGAVKEVAPIEEAMVRASAAGNDLLLVCHTYEAERRAQASLLKAYEEGTLDRRELEESAARVEALMAKRPERFGPARRISEEGQALAWKVARESVTVLQERELPFPIPADLLPELKLTIVFPRLSELASKLVIEEPFLREEEYLRSWFAGLGLVPEIRLVGIDPTEQELAEVEKGLGDRTAIVFCYDAHFYPAWRRLVETVQEKARHAVVVPLRDPYDAEFVVPRASAVTAFGFRWSQIEAVLERVFGDRAIARSSD
jgi:beta-N-acetylhexosaminidase